MSPDYMAPVMHTELDSKEHQSKTAWASAPASHVTSPPPPCITLGAECLRTPPHPRVCACPQGDKPRAYFYLDPYSRPAEKRGGAWMAEVSGICILAGAAGCWSQLLVMCRAGEQ
jgi:hypothetical protein